VTIADDARELARPIGLFRHVRIIGPRIRARDGQACRITPCGGRACLQSYRSIRARCAWPQWRVP
jgi:hypothetical protein